MKPPNMKQKLTHILMVCISLALFSCRGADDEIPVKQKTVENKKNLLKTSMKIYDSIKVEAHNEHENPPKDPPKTGTNWRIEN